jgi:putative component of membrane protein insertase Oxa1/YidC/SpoIIIJ protein YidD
MSVGGNDTSPPSTTATVSVENLVYIVRYIHRKWQLCVISGLVTSRCRYNVHNSGYADRSLTPEQLHARAVLTVVAT